jgi:hypothetical protein
LALRLSTTGTGVDVDVSVGSGVEVGEDVAGVVSVGMGVNVSGTDVGDNVSAAKTLVGEAATSGEGDAGVCPVTVQASVVSIHTMRRWKFLFFMG